jgi:hypothetical protein
MKDGLVKHLKKYFFIFIVKLFHLIKHFLSEKIVTIPDTKAKT